MSGLLRDVVVIVVCLLVAAGLVWGICGDEGDEL